QEYDMTRIGICIQVYLDAVTVVAKNLPSLVSDLSKCVNFQVEANLEQVNLGMLSLEVFSWLQSLAKSMHCLWALIEPSLVRSQIYSLPEIGNCVNIYLNTISDITGKTMGLVRDLVKCVQLVTKFNVESLDYSSFKNLVNEFMVKLVSLPACPMDMLDSLRTILKPHIKRIKSYKCSYLGGESIKLNLVKISKCTQVTLELIGELTTKVIPAFSKLVSCVGYIPELDIRKVGSFQMMIIVYQFFQEATKGDCLINVYTYLSAAMDPYLKRRNELKCSYLIAKEPLC
ncbi:hypothetical protein KR074_005433, partial [Drosophila pseudoananassae]